MNHLTRIYIFYSGYRDFDAVAQKQAEEMINLLSNKHFLSTLAYQLGKPSLSLLQVTI